MNPVENIEEGTSVSKMLLKEIARPRQTLYYKRLKDQFQQQADQFAPVTLDVEQENIFACEEEEASKLDPRKFQQIGVSDGTVFHTKLKESGLFGKWVPVAEAKRLYKEAEQADIDSCRGKFKRPVSKSVYTLGSNVPDDVIRGIK